MPGLTAGNEWKAAFGMGSSVTCNRHAYIICIFTQPPTLALGQQRQHVIAGCVAVWTRAMLKHLFARDGVPQLARHEPSKVHDRVVDEPAAEHDEAERVDADKHEAESVVFDVDNVASVVEEEEGGEIREKELQQSGLRLRSRVEVGLSAAYAAGMGMARGVRFERHGAMRTICTWSQIS